MKYELINKFGWIKRFKYFDKLVKFVNKIPDYELCYFKAYKNDDICRVGQFYRLKNGMVNIKF